MSVLSILYVVPSDEHPRTREGIQWIVEPFDPQQHQADIVVFVAQPSDAQLKQLWNMNKYYLVYDAYDGVIPTSFRYHLVLAPSRRELYHIWKHHFPGMGDIHPLSSDPSPFMDPDYKGEELKRCYDDRDMMEALRQGKLPLMYEPSEFLTVDYVFSGEQKVASNLPHASEQCRAAAMELEATVIGKQLRKKLAAWHTLHQYLAFLRDKVKQVIPTHTRFVVYRAAFCGCNISEYEEEPPRNGEVRLFFHDDTVPPLPGYIPIKIPLFRASLFDFRKVRRNYADPSGTLTNRIIKLLIFHILPLSVQKTVYLDLMCFRPVREPFMHASRQPFWAPRHRTRTAGHEEFATLVEQNLATETFAGRLFRIYNRMTNRTLSAAPLTENGVMYRVKTFLIKKWMNAWFFELVRGIPRDQCSCQFTRIMLM